MTGTLAPLMPHTPAELIAVAELLDEHRRFIATLPGVAWPSLDEEIARPEIILATLAQVRRGRAWPSPALSGASGR